jgi:hypothetical protein
LTSVKDEGMLKEETTKMTSKRQPEDQGSGPKVDYAELLLTHYTRAEEIIEKAKEFNRKNGLPEELMSPYIDYTMPAGKEKYLNWLKDVTSEHNGKFYDMKTLKAAGFVSDEDTPLDDIQYPRRELFQLYRIKTPKGEFLRRTEMWYGLQQDGTEKSLGVGDLDFYIEPSISYVYADPGTKYMQFNPRSTEARRAIGIGENVKMRVAKLATDVMFPGNEMGTLVYTSPFSAETIYEMIKVARGAFDDHNNGCSLALKDESKSRNSYSVTTLEEFLTPSFDETFKRLSTPSTNINVKDLVDQLRSNKGSSGQELESKVQYQ